MAVEEVQSEGRVLRGPLGEDLDVVVADAGHVLGPGQREGVGQGLHNGHLGSAGKGLVVVVPEYGGVRDLSLCE